MDDLGHSLLRDQVQAEPVLFVCDPKSSPVAVQGLTTDNIVLEMQHKS